MSHVGARGYIVKRRLQSDLLPALNLALAGQYFISPHAFAGERKDTGNGHLLEFYLDESIFFQKASELAYGALISEGAVSMFLSKVGLHFVRERLRAWGLNYHAAIDRGQYQTYSVEDMMPSLLCDHQPRLGGWWALLGNFWERAASRSKLTIISDMIPTLLRLGYDYEVAAKIEEIWNDLVPKRSCTVYCGCSVMHLSSKENREPLSRICGEHGKVIPIDW